jgi:hypothetical protein
LEKVREAYSGEYCDVVPASQQIGLDIVEEWLREKGRGYSDYKETWGTPPPPAPEDPSEDELKPAQYVLVEYFIEGRLRLEPVDEPKDKTRRYMEMVEKYGKTEEDFKKAFRRIERIHGILKIPNRITSEQARSYKKDLMAVVKYFEREGRKDLAEKVQAKLDSVELN